MKKIYTWAAGFALCAGLVSCEMKEELWGNGGEVPTETGKVELGVAVDDKTNVVITKAAADDTGEERPGRVDASEYEVIFTHQSADFVQKYVYEDIEGKEVTLPVGEYIVESHTPGELLKKMTTPYYGGEARLAVTSNITSDAKVVCTMQNSRIVLTYDPEFSAKFDTWTITIDDGSDNVLTFTKEMGMTLDAVYWHFAEDCAAIQINVIAANENGEIRESRTITKPAGTENMNWTGGDALTITMEPAPEQEDPDNPSGVVGSGINIKVEAFFPNSTKEDDTIWVDVDGDDTTGPTDPDEGEGGEEGTEEPDTPTTGGPSITSEYLSSGISYTIKANPDWVEDNGLVGKYNVVDAPEKAEVIISAPKGFQSIFVKINAQGGFAAAAGIMGLTNGVDILAADLNAELKGLLNPPTDSNATTYILDIAPFFPMMAMYGPTAPDTYDFVITVTDKEGGKTEPEEVTLSVTITEE